jgi:hypothetical protein
MKDKKENSIQFNFTTIAGTCLVLFIISLFFYISFKSNKNMSKHNRELFNKHNYFMWLLGLSEYYPKK